MSISEKTMPGQLAEHEIGNFVLDFMRVAVRRAQKRIASHKDPGGHCAIPEIRGIPCRYQQGSDDCIRCAGGIPIQAKSPTPGIK
jgi:hypothetical protein